MSTGKRLAKRSIIGTRVCAPVPVSPGVELYLPGVISATRGGPEPGPTMVYTITFNPGAAAQHNKLAAQSVPTRCEYRAGELIGPGFGSVAQAKLTAGQRVFITYNGREVAATITALDGKEAQLALETPASKDSLLSCSSVKRRIEELRLLESRKSARLQETDSPDFIRLASGHSAQSQDQPQHEGHAPRGRTSSMSSSISSASTVDLPLSK